MKGALGRKLGGVAAWKWLIGAGGAILLYRHYTGGSTTAPATSGTVDNTGGVDYVPIYETPGSDTTTQPLQPAEPAPTTPSGKGTGPSVVVPGIASIKPPPKKRTRTTRKPHHQAKGHKAKPAAGSHRAATPGRKRTHHTKAAPAPARSSTSSHRAAHPQKGHKASTTHRTGPKRRGSGGGAPRRPS